MKIKVGNQSHYALPGNTPDHSTGLSILINTHISYHLKSSQRVHITEGKYEGLPDGCNAAIHSTSGLVIKHGIPIVNTPGSNDPDKCGEIRKNDRNLSDTYFDLLSSERLAQRMMVKVGHLTRDAVGSPVQTRSDAVRFSCTGTTC